MDAFIGQRFEDFETIAGVNVIKLYGDSLLSARLDVYKRQMPYFARRLMSFSLFSLARRFGSSNAIPT